MASGNATSNMDSTAAVVADTGATADLVHCYDTNICVGHNDCKIAAHACAGQGACKNQGFVAMPSKAYADVDGSIEGRVKTQGMLNNQQRVDIYRSKYRIRLAGVISSDHQILSHYLGHELFQLMV
jgi:hypothetical protein